MKRAAQNPMFLILAMVVGFGVLSLIFEEEILLYIGLGLGGLVMVVPATAPYIAWGWNKIAEALGWLNSKVILTVVYFIFLVPFGLIYQWTRKNPLQLKDKDDSLFHVRDHSYTRKDLENGW